MVSFSEGLFHLFPSLYFRSTSTAVDWRSFKLNQQRCCERKKGVGDSCSYYPRFKATFRTKLKRSCKPRRKPERVPKKHRARERISGQLKSALRAKLVLHAARNNVFCLLQVIRTSLFLRIFFLQLFNFSVKTFFGFKKFICVPFDKALRIISCVVDVQ